MPEEFNTWENIKPRDEHRDGDQARPSEPTACEKAFEQAFENQFGVAPHASLSVDDDDIALYRRFHCDGFHAGRNHELSRGE